MAKTKIIFATLFLGGTMLACTDSSSTNSKILNEQPNSKTLPAKTYISTFEIPATDILRAVNFYQAILEIKIEKMDLEGMQMGILP